MMDNSRNYDIGVCERWVEERNNRILANGGFTFLIDGINSQSSLGLMLEAGDIPNVAL